MSSDHMKEATQVLVEALNKPEDADPNALVAQLMSANLRDYQNTTGALIDGYQRQISDLEATLGAIRTEINRLFAGDYMPNQDAIIRAVFYPSRELIDQCRFRKEDF